MIYLGSLTINVLEPEYAKTYINALEKLGIKSEDYQHLFLNLNAYFIEDMADSVIGHLFVGHYISSEYDDELEVHKYLNDTYLTDMVVTSEGLIASLFPELLKDVVESTGSINVKSTTQYIFLFL